MWALEDLLELSKSGAETERLPRNNLTCHKGNNTDRTRVPNDVQRGGGKLHKNLAGHDSRGPEGGA